MFIAQYLLLQKHFTLCSTLTCVISIFLDISDIFITKFASFIKSTNYVLKNNQNGLSCQNLVNNVLIQMHFHRLSMSTYTTHRATLLISTHSIEKCHSKIVFLIISNILENHKPNLSIKLMLLSKMVQYKKKIIIIIINRMIQFMCTHAKPSFYSNDTFDIGIIVK